jgi:hypothetical protein
MRINFAFGRTGLTLELLEGFDYQLLEARSAVPLDDPATAIEYALDAPIDCPPLAEMARGKRSAAISICESRGQRPTTKCFLLCWPDWKRPAFRARKLPS